MWLDTCIVQMDAVEDGIAACTWTLYFNVTVMPDEKFLVQLLTFNIVYKFSDARRKIPGVTTNF